MDDPLTYLIGVSLFLVAAWMLRECIFERDPVRLAQKALALVGTGLTSIVLTGGARVNWFVWVAMAFLLAAAIVGLYEGRKTNKSPS